MLCRSGACSVFKTVVLVLCLLAVIGNFYAIDQAVISLGEISRNATRVEETPLPQQTCLELCLEPWTGLNQQGRCCDGALCKGKSECQTERLEELDHDHRQAIILLVVTGALQLIILGLFGFYCFRKKRNSSVSSQPESNITTSFYVFKDDQSVQTPSLQSQLLKESHPQGVCPICLDRTADRKVVKLECGHTFHSKCLREWIHNRQNCPVCRQKI